MPTPISCDPKNVRVLESFTSDMRTSQGGITRKNHRGDRRFSSATLHSGWNILENGVFDDLLVDCNQTAPEDRFLMEFHPIPKFKTFFFKFFGFPEDPTRHPKANKEKRKIHLKKLFSFTFSPIFHGKIRTSTGATGSAGRGGVAAGAAGGCGHSTGCSRRRFSARSS